MYNLLENEIEETKEWWRDEVFVAELDRRFETMEDGTDKGFTVEQLEASIERLRNKR